LHFGKVADKNFSINNQKELQESKDWVAGMSSLYTPNNSGIWKDIQLVDGEDFDYLLVIDCVYGMYDERGRKKEIFDPAKTIVIKAEPKALRSRYQYNQYNDSFDHLNLKTYEYLTLWGWLGLNYNQIQDPSNFIKTKELSTIISANQGLEGHRRRLDFLPYLDSINNYEYDMLGDERSCPGIFSRYKHYKGKINNKIEGLGAYKYHYTSENCIQDDYFSEKIVDSILSGCYTFYTGCSNIEKYIDERIFTRVDLNDYERALVTIKRGIRNGLWEQRVDIIQQEKRKILEQLNPLNLAWAGIHNEPLYYEK